MMQLISIFVIAIGLSMDAFSLAILYGTLNFNRRKTILLSFFVGVFHFFMPLFGNLLGIMLLSILPVTTNIVVGIIFFVISTQMFLSIFKDEEIIDLKGILAIIFFAFTVSIDSFSVGIGLNAICNKKIIAVTIFSVISSIFTFMGLSIGSKLTEKFGKVSTIIGIIVLFVMSFFYLFFYNG
ncbi:MAG: manganese efflux pump [Bacilli bacterium]|nr:manganese efflux pump [Bacilli bacterium]